MTRIVYLNGQFLPDTKASLGIEDRGSLFADGAYEVLRYYDGRAFAMEAHANRLHNSLEGLRFPAECIAQLAPLLPGVSDELVKQNQLSDAKVYWQVTRGQGPRSHVISDALQPTVMMIAYPETPRPASSALQSVRVTVVDDTRWTQCWIKSLMLLPNTLAKSHAEDHGFGEAIFERAKPTPDAPRHLTEGSSTNLFIVRDGELWTHPADGWILPGITRAVVIELAESLGIPCHEKVFDRQALLAADEAFICGTTTQITVIAEVDGKKIGSPQGPWPIAKSLFEAYCTHLAES